ncbi:hypothetical protein DFQ13_10297 [Actinokineospora spheciospongiae]|nr:hypothetical protein DFQ13_10297 [Actinokineospora spheciospongiae]
MERVARSEQERWSTAALSTQDTAAARPADAAGPDGWHAYWPLDSERPTAGTGSWLLRFRRVSAAGTVLVFRFTWLDRPDPPEYLLHVDLHDVRHGDVDGASVRLLERVEFLTAAPGWPDALTAAVSDRVSLVLPPR